MGFRNDPSCVLYLPLYKLDGNVIADKSAYGHLCTVTGAVWTPQGYSFDGTDDIIKVDAHTALEIAGHITILAWAKIDPDVGLSGHILTKGADNDYQMFVSSNKYRASLNNVGVQLFPNTPANLNDNVFRLWGLTYDLTTIRGYLNYTQIASLAYSTAITTSATQVGIGNRLNSTTDFFGVIGEVWIYNRALNPLEIQRIYLATKWRYK